MEHATPDIGATAGLPLEVIMRAIGQVNMGVVLRASALVLVAAAAAMGGPLDPPPGPVSPTPGPEPRIAINDLNTPGDGNSVFRIAQPGSYYLTGSVTASAFGESAIEVAVGNVTIDLNGFELLSTTTVTVSGVVAQSSTSSIVVHNGTARGWGQIGIDLFSTEACAVRNVTVLDTIQIGIRGGTSCQIERCTVVGSNIGMQAASASTFRDCIAREAGTDGFSLGQGSVVINCVAASNGQDGFEIGLSSGVTITGCSAFQNGGSGIRCGADNIVRGNACTGNGQTAINGAGIATAQAGSMIEDNIVSGNDTGLLITGTTNVIRRNTARGNPTAEYTIGAGNAAGPILTPATMVGNTSPDANFDM